MVGVRDDAHRARPGSVTSRRRDPARQRGGPGPARGEHRVGHRRRPPRRGARRSGHARGRSGERARLTRGPHAGARRIRAFAPGLPRRRGGAAVHRRGRFRPGRPPVGRRREPGVRRSAARGPVVRGPPPDRPVAEPGAGSQRDQPGDPGARGRCRDRRSDGAARHHRPARRRPSSRLLGHRAVGLRAGVRVRDPRRGATGRAVASRDRRRPRRCARGRHAGTRRRAGRRRCGCTAGLAGVEAGVVGARRQPCTAPDVDGAAAAGTATCPAGSPDARSASDSDAARSPRHIAGATLRPTRWCRRRLARRAMRPRCNRPRPSRPRGVRPDPSRGGKAPAGSRGPGGSTRARTRSPPRPGGCPAWATCSTTDCG